MRTVIPAPPQRTTNSRSLLLAQEFCLGTSLSVGLPKDVFPIYLTTFMDMLGYTLLIPLLPAMAKHYGAHDWMVGMLLSIPAFCATLAAPAWGKFSDRA